MCFVRLSKQAVSFPLDKIKIFVFFLNRGAHTVFTARYALSPSIKQARFVFNPYPANVEKMVSS